MAEETTSTKGNIDHDQKRKRRRSDNPLAVARGKKKAESLWHRKSGAGYDLFVQFYARQHPGAVTCESQCTTMKNDNDEHIQRPSPNSLLKTCNSTGVGLSRAAKRRKKKKGKTVQGRSEQDPTSPETTANLEAMEIETLPKPVMNSKILVALNKLNKDPNWKMKESFRSFLLSLSDPLPLTFRIRRGIDIATQQQIIRKIHEFDSLVESFPFDTSIFQAKSSDLSRETLHKVSPELKEFLVSESKRGTVARQEFGSMLPVIALSKGSWLKQGSRVLDLCASPGSKTLQALEIVGETGRVKANDIKESRLGALKEAVGRSGMPHVERIKYTMYDASKYPIPSPSSRLFDAVICDVPCSGDGTIRKDPHILREWTPNTSNALHSLQLSILRRAIECVKVGGVVCYSTCSLNPVEDEAVVCQILQDFSKDNNQQVGSVVELQDWPAMEGFCARPGVQTWKVAHYDGAAADDDEEGDEPQLKWYATVEEAKSRGMDSASSSMWPPENVPPGLGKCVRLHPQDHDTGGFFVALLKRVR